ncbi:unnamed protein product [Urochloa humidicola]
MIKKKKENVDAGRRRRRHCPHGRLEASPPLPLAEPPADGTGRDLTHAALACQPADATRSCSGPASEEGRTGHTAIGGHPRRSSTCSVDPSAPEKAAGLAAGLVPTAELACLRAAACWGPSAPEQTAPRRRATRAAAELVVAGPCSAWGLEWRERVKEMGWREFAGEMRERLILLEESAGGHGGEMDPVVSN